MQSPKKYRIDEVNGSDGSSPSTAYFKSADLFADLLSQKIHSMLKQGDLIVEDGVILPSRSSKS
jgi:hypothetical protein